MFRRRKPSQDIDYTKLGKSMEQILIQDYINLLGSTRRQIWGSFVRGIFAGLGGVIGATVVVAVLLTVLHFFGGAPVVGHYIRGVSDSISSGKK